MSGPPHSQEAEAAAIGAMLLKPEAALSVAMKLCPPEAFYVPAHRSIVEALYAMALDGEKGGGINAVTLGDELKRLGTLESVGGVVFVDRLIDQCPTAAHVEHFLRIVREKFILRRVVDVARGVEKEAEEDRTAPEVLLRGVPDKFIEIVSDVREEKEKAALMAESIGKWEAAKDGGRPAIGIATPWASLTQATCGLETGITILAGKPSSGKTTLEDCLAIHAAEMGVPVGRVTLDSTAGALLERTLCRKAGVSLPKLKFGYSGASEIARLREEAEIIGNYPMWITSTARDIRDILSWARAARLKNGIGLLTIDYVQIIKAEEMGRNEWDDNCRISFVSGRLKDLSFDLGIPVVILSQFSREHDKAERPPRLSDLRGSGSLEQDADKVVFLWKDPDTLETKLNRPVWVELAKNKSGETCRLPFWMHPHYFTFEEAADGFGASPQLEPQPKRARKKSEPLPVEKKEEPPPVFVQPEFEPQHEGSDGTEKKLAASRADAPLPKAPRAPSSIEAPVVRCDTCRSVIHNPDPRYLRSVDGELVGRCGQCEGLEVKTGLAKRNESGYFTEEVVSDEVFRA